MRTLSVYKSLLRLMCKARRHFSIFQVGLDRKCMKNRETRCFVVGLHNYEVVFQGTCDRIVVIWLFCAQIVTYHYSDNIVGVKKKLWSHSAIPRKSTLRIAGSILIFLTPWLMELSGSMPRSQGLSNNSYPEPNQPNSPPRIDTYLFKVHSNIVLPSTPRPPYISIF